MTSGITESSGARDGLRKRLARGLSATAFSPIVSAIIQLGSVPLLLHVWGAAKYGDWLLLSAIPSYLTLSDLGLGDASGTDMSMRMAAGDQAGALQTFQSSWVFVTSVSFTILFLVLSFVWSIPWQVWLKLSSVSSHQAGDIIGVLAAYVVLSQQNSVLESGYRCDGHYASGAFWVTVLRLAETAAATVVALAGGSLLWVAVTYFAVRGVGTVGYALLLRHLSPWIHFGIRKVRWNAIRQMAAPALGFMAFPLGYALSFQGLAIVIGARLGPLAVVAFSTLRTLSRLSLQVIVVIKHALWPELSRAFGAGDISLARRLHRHACQASLALSLSGSLFLLFAGPYIYRLWIGHGVSFDDTCFHVFLLAATANSLWETSSVISMSVNGHCRIALVYSGITLLSTGLAWILMPAMGIVGAAAALVFADGCMAAVVLSTALSHVQDSGTRFAAALFTVPQLRKGLPLAPEA